MAPQVMEAYKLKKQRNRVSKVRAANAGPAAGQLLQFLAAAHLVGQRQQFGPLGCLPPFVAALNPGNPIVAGLNRAGPPNRCLASGGHLALRLAHRCAARAAPAPGAVPCEGAARSRVCVVAHTPPLSLTILYKFIANL